MNLLAFGCPTQAIVAAYGFDERTIAAWLDRSGTHSQKVYQAPVVQGKLEVRHVQTDEINVKGAGFRAWLAMALMISTRLWLIGCVYNFCQPHHSLRRYNWRKPGGKWVEFSPAMASGLTDHLWSIRELLWYKVPPSAVAPPKMRGRPPKGKS